MAIKKYVEILLSDKYFIELKEVEVPFATSNYDGSMIFTREQLEKAVEELKEGQKELSEEIKKILEEYDKVDMFIFY
jgi:exonuclease III